MNARLLSVLLLVATLCSACGVEVVDTGHTGVETRFGKVVSDALPSGLYFYNPFTSDITEMDTRILKWAGETQAYTKDVQQAKIQFTVNYRLDAAKVPQVYKDVGVDWAGKLVGQVVFEEIKRELGQHEAVALVANRDAASRTIESRLRELLAQRDVILTGFQITNIDYSHEFEQAVEAKVVATQNAIAEQNRTVQVQERAKQTVLSAQAEAESMKIRANALEQNPKLVEWEAVQKWDGHLPVYNFGGGATPFITVPNNR